MNNVFREEVSGLGPGPFTEGSLVIDTLSGIYFDPNGQPATGATLTLQWGDGTTSSATPTVDLNGNFSVSFQHTYLEEGNLLLDGGHFYRLTVTINDDAGNSFTDNTFEIGVFDAPLTLTGAPPPNITGSEGTPITGVPSVIFTDANPIAKITDFTATINWGDNTSSPGTVAVNPSGGFVVTGPAHTYADEGNYTEIVTIKDVGGSTLNVPIKVSVLDAPLDGVVVFTGRAAPEGTPSDPPIVTFTDANPNAKITDFTATINWGDNTTSPGMVSPNASGPGFVLTFPQHTYADEGNYTEAVTIKDIGGSTLDFTAHVTVLDADHLTTGAAMFVNNPITLKGTVTATFTDDGPSLPVASDLIATINWGDGTISTGTLNEQQSGTSHALSVSGSHIYATTGQFPVTVTLTDDGTANSVSEKISANVVAAPRITGTVANQPVTDHATIDPFAHVKITDLNVGQTDTVTVTPTQTANGTLFDPNAATDGSTITNGVYKVTGTAAQVTADLDALIFHPTPYQVPPGNTVTTGFTIKVIDTAGMSATDNTTSIVAKAVAPNFALLQQDATNFLLAQYATDPAVAEANINGPLTQLLKDLGNFVAQPKTSTGADVPITLLNLTLPVSIILADVYGQSPNLAADSATLLGIANTIGHGFHVV